MLNYEIADQEDQFPSIDTNSHEDANNQSSHRLIDGANFVRTKCTEHYRKPVSLLSFIVTIQMLWIFGLTIQVNSSSHSTQNSQTIEDVQMSQNFQTIEDLQMSLQQNFQTIENLQMALQLANSKIEDLELAFGTNRDDYELRITQNSQMIEDLQMLFQFTNSTIVDLERGFGPNQDDLEVRIGSEVTDNLRLTGQKIWFQDSKEIEIHEVPTTSSREWSQSDLQITVGTKITWTWTSNENLVEASEIYAVKSNPSFSSGAIEHGGTISHTFEIPGTYYFVSENTASMRGKVVVTGSFIKDGSLSVNNITVSGTFFGTKYPGTIHSYQITRNSGDGTCPEGTSAIRATTGTSDYSTYSAFYGYSLFSYLIICVYQ